MPKLLLFPELMEHGVLLGRRQVDRLEHKGDFPKRVPIGESRVGWVERSTRMLSAQLMDVR
jgi:prophage regulatory protein